MKILNNEIRPIGYLTIELDEVELRTIVSAFEEIQYYKNVSLDRMGGRRQELYDKLSDILIPKP